MVHCYPNFCLEMGHRQFYADLEGKKKFVILNYIVKKLE